MKTIIISLSILLFGITVNAQKIASDQVPMAVVNTFKTKISDTVNVVWNLAGDVYEATFTKGELTGHIFIKSTSIWEKSVWQLPYVYVPTRIKDHVAANYKGFKVQKSFLEYRTDGDFYVIEMKKKKLIQKATYNIKCEFLKVE